MKSFADIYFDKEKAIDLAIMMCGSSPFHEFKGWAHLNHYLFLAYKIAPDYFKNILFFNSEEGPIIPFFTEKNYKKAGYLVKRRGLILLTNIGWERYHYLESDKQNESIFRLFKIIHEKYDQYDETQIKLLVFSKSPEMFTNRDKIKKEFTGFVNNFISVGHSLEDVVNLFLEVI